MMLTGLLSLLGSSAFGSLMGGLFAWLNRKTDIQLQAMQYAQALALRDKDYEQAKLEAEGRKDVAIVEGDAAIESARMAALGVAQAADTDAPAEELKAAGWWAWTLVLAGAARRFIRPGLTVLLVGAALVIDWLLLRYFLADGWHALDAPAKRELATQAVTWVTGQASVVIGYWFVSRGTAAAR